MKTLVINLPSRPDRLKLFQQHWNWLDFEIVNGIHSDILHTGCGLAHIKAIRKGLEHNDWCLVLEDDARIFDKKEFLELINEATKSIQWDAVLLGPTAHPEFSDPISVRVSKNFMKCSRTKSIVNTTATLWSKKCIPLINEFEQILNQNHIFPIDRMLTSFAYPWICTRTNGDEAPNATDISILPNVWISMKCLAIQEPGLLSDNSHELSRDLLKDTQPFLTRLRTACSKDDSQ